eukprot:1374342-Ditylum_brightwellii.AAC.1
MKPYPQELASYKPLIGADDSYSQLHKMIKELPYKEFGVTGKFHSHETYVATFQMGEYKPFPSLQELYDKMNGWPSEFDHTIEQESHTTI